MGQIHPPLPIDFGDFDVKGVADLNDILHFFHPALR